MILMLLFSFLAAPAQAATRAVMEGLVASANTVYVDTATVRFTVAVSTPAACSTCTLHVGGSGAITNNFRVDSGSSVFGGAYSPPLATDGRAAVYQRAPSSTIGNHIALGVTDDGGAVGTRTQIGIGYHGSLVTHRYPVVIGARTVSSSQQNNSAFFVANRSSTDGTAALTENLTVMPSGNVGIGITDPEANLEVKSTATPTGYVLLASSQTETTRLFSIDGSGNGYVAGSFTAASFSSPGTPTLSSTQTWSGANTFLSTSTFGVSPGTGTHNTAVYTSTANYSAVARGVPTRVIYSSFTAVSEIVLSGLISTYTHTVKFSALQNTSNGTWNMTLDGSTATYRWANTRGLSDSTGETQGSSSDTECQITGTSAVRATDPGSVTMILTLAAGDPNGDKMLASWIGSTVLSDNNFMSIRGGCLHDPAGSGDRRTAVRLFPSAGTVTGTIQVFAEAE